MFTLVRSEAARKYLLVSFNFGFIFFFLCVASWVLSFKHRDSMRQINWITILRPPLRDYQRSFLIACCEWICLY